MRKKACLVFIFVLFSQIALSGNIFSQSVSRPDRGTVGNVPYDSSGVENINLQNGNVGLSIPLASLPSIAGGKLSFGLSAYYNSKLWDTYVEQRFTGPDPGSTFYDVSIPKVSDFGGWRIGGQYGIYTELAHGDYKRHQGYSDIDDTILYNNSWQKIFFVTPDGSKHEIRPLGYQSFWGANDFYRGYFKDTPYTTGTPMRYYSVDGSYIWLTLFPNGSSLAWEASLPDGTKIQQSNDSVQRIIDTNGNKIKIFSDTQGTHYQDEQTSREIRVAYNSGTGRTEIWYQTVGGVWQKVEIVFGTTSVTGKFYSVVKPAVPYSGGCTFQEQFGDDLTVVREIIFPQTESGQSPPKYSFSYNSDETDPTAFTYYPLCNTQSATYQNSSKGLGEVSQMTTPTGAVLKYSYSQDNQHITNDGSSDMNATSSAITQKTITHDGTVDTWNYSIAPTGTNASVTNPDGSTQNLEAYFHFSSQPSSRGGTTGFGGLVFRETQSNKIIIERRWARQVFNGAYELTSGSDKIVFNPVVTEEYTTLLGDAGNPAKMSAKTFQYDFNGNVKETKEYDWFDPGLVSRDSLGVPLGIPAGQSPLRITTSSFHNSPADASAQEVYAKTNNSILNALKESTVGGSITQISYDDLAYGTAPTKGNPTATKAWNDTNSQWITSSVGYDGYGNVTSTTDPKGSVTQIFYEDSTHAMPTKTIVDPQNGTGQHISTATYDFSTGLPLTSTDVNGNVSSISYVNHLLGAVDPFGRAGTTYSPYISIDGVNKRLTAKTYYEDAARRIRSESDLYNEGDALIKSRVSSDQLGRAVLSEKNENGANAYTIFSETKYNSPIDRTVMTSNPRRSTASPTDGWTRATADTLGRSVEVATFSGAAQPPLTGTAGGNFTGKVTTLYSANTTTVIDQAGKQRRSTVNALGQLIRVDEPNDAGQLDVGGVPAQSTSYVYDALGNLTSVTQNGTGTIQCGANNTSCSQTRTFAYDSLSRLKSATNPESGTISYIYDNNGNLTHKTDARSITTTYGYDALNRVKTRDYSDSTPDVLYTYDNLTYAKGRLTKVTSGTLTNGVISNPLSVTEYQAFDQFGRVTQSRQLVDGTAYGNPMTYKYNLAGAMVEQKYPSGRTVKNVLDSDGDLSIVQSSKNSASGFFNYAKNFTYTAAGAVSSMQLGNGKWESTAFNSRLQPTQIALGTIQDGTDKLKLNFAYNTSGQSDNNGNVLSQTITVPGEIRNNTTYAAFTATQNYTYDSLNRLKSAVETIAGQTGWQQTFKYDRYGNRNFDTTVSNSVVYNGSLTDLSNCPTNVCNPTPNAANNRLNGYSYDNAGNTINDADGQIFTYDGENKQTEVVKNNVSLGKYYYDGDGKRVKKIAYEMGQLQTTIFIYDASGRMVAEYSTTVASTMDAKVSYLTNDHLGSPRITTDANGAVTSRRDFMPFGEEIQRASYGMDTVRQKFTSYERDDEADLDFAQNRYYNPKHGRFTSPDEPFFDQWEENPQSWNLYLYVRNNPLNLVDPFGTKADCPPGSPEGCFERDGKYYTKDENGDEIEHDPTPIRIETRVAGTQAAIIGPIIRGLVRFISWLFRRSPKSAPKPATPPTQPPPVQPIPAPAIPSWKNVKPSRPLDKMGHAKKHLPDFQKIDPSLTKDDVAKILQHVKDTGKPTPSSFNSTNYEAVVDIAGQSVTVRANVSAGGVIKTGYPVK